MLLIVNLLSISHSILNYIKTNNVYNSQPLTDQEMTFDQ